jgi:hypothetical protein
MNKRLMSIAIAVALPRFFIMGDSGNSLLPSPKDTGSQMASQPLVKLKEKLERTTLPSEKLGILKEISSSHDSLEKQAVLEYYRSLPPSELTTNPHSDFFKVEVFEIVLPALDFKERKKFVENVLDNELINMRSAYCNALDNKYPKTLWNKIVSIIESDESTRDLRDRFSSIAKDELLPLQVRSSALAANMRYDLENDKVAKIQKLQDVLDNIPFMPEAVLPWEHYVSKEKRIAYHRDSLIYLAESKRVDEWRKSGKEVIFEGNLEFLQSHGLKSIEIIVSMLERTDLPLEHRDCLAEMAAKILARLRNLSPQEREVVDQLVSKLEKYIDRMADKGAFCRRYYAIQGLRLYYRNTGIKEGYPFKDGQLLKENNAVTGTNVLAIASNTISGSGYLINTNMNPRQEKTLTPLHRKYFTNNDKSLVVCATLGLLLLLGGAFFVILKVKVRK